MYSEFRVKTGQFDVAISRVTEMYSEFRVKTGQFDVAISRVTEMYSEFRVKTGQFDVAISRVTKMFSDFEFSKTKQVISFVTKATEAQIREQRTREVGVLYIVHD